MWCDPEFAIPALPDGTPDFSVWPNCETPDCEGKACTWADLPKLCHPCGERIVGPAAMLARYFATHSS